MSRPGRPGPPARGHPRAWSSTCWSGTARWRSRCWRSCGPTRTWPAAGRGARVPGGRGGVRGRGRGRAAPGRRAGPADPDLDRDRPPRGRQRRPRGPAHGRRCSAGTRRGGRREVDHYLARVEAERRVADGCPTTSPPTPPALGAPSERPSRTLSGVATLILETSDDLAGVEDAQRVERLLDGPVHPQPDRSELLRQPVPLEQADAVLAGARCRPAPGPAP